jgi:hypothetical protein
MLMAALGQARVQLQQGASNVFAAISGTVRSERGNGAPGIRVTVLRMEYRRGLERWIEVPGVQPATSDAAGRYRVHDIPPGLYVVSASPPSWYAEAAVGPTTADDLARAAAILRGDSPAPKEPEHSSVAYVATYFGGVDRVSQATRVPLRAGDELEGIDLQTRLTTTAVVAGHVEDPSGNRVPKFGMSVTSVESGEDETRRLRVLLASSAVLPGVGAFEVPQVPSGDYDVFVWALTPKSLGEPAAPTGAQASDVIWTRQKLSVRGLDQRNVVFNLERGIPIQGRVIALDSANPIAPAGVSVSLRQWEILRWNYLPSLQVGSDGEFRFGGVVPGRYEMVFDLPSGWHVESIRVRGSDADFADQPINVPPDSSGLVITANLIRSLGRLVGTIDSGGMPLRGFSVIAIAKDERIWLTSSRRIRSEPVSSDGQFALTGLPTGQYYLAVVEDLETNRLGDSEYLRAVCAAGVLVGLENGRTTVQNLRISR